MSVDDLSWASIGGLPLSIFVVRKHGATEEHSKGSVKGRHSVRNKRTSNRLSEDIFTRYLFPQLPACKVDRTAAAMLSALSSRIGRISDDCFQALGGEQNCHRRVCQGPKDIRLRGPTRGGTIY